MENNKLISELQITADELAYTIINERELFGRLSIVQSICDFNIIWLYQLPFTTVRREFIDFISENISSFKRKINIKEALKIDSIIHFNSVDSMESLKEYLIL